MLNIWKDRLRGHNRIVSLFLNNSASIGHEYENAHKNISDIGFNVFKLASDIYYRENFHSDIIKAFLDPLEKHNESTTYLQQFIKLLNTINPNHIINTEDYQNIMVKREASQIDILVKDELSKRAIIIENKINNAKDTHRQLPRYYEIIKRDYEVDAIVYITIDRSKRPDRNDWTDVELKEINSLLKIIPAYDRNNEPNLYNDWLIPSIANSKNADSAFVLRQYASLIKFLNTNYMDTTSLELFYETLKENENLKTSLSIRNMLNDLPEYMAIRVEDRYKNHYYPFERIWRYKQRDTVFEAFKSGDIYLKLDVWCSERGYKVHFWNPNNEEYNIMEEFKTHNILSGYVFENDKTNNVFKEFAIFEEEQLFEFIDGLLVVLKEYKKI